MSTETHEYKDLISDLAKGVVEEVAPHELKRYDKLATAYFENPQPRGNKEQELQADLTLAILTPVVLAVLTAILNVLLEGSLDGVKKATADFVAEKIKGLFTKKQESKDSFQVNREDLMQAHEAAVREAMRWPGVDNATAQRIADSALSPLM